MDKLFHAQPETIAGPLRTRPLREKLAIVEHGIDHPLDDSELPKERRTQVPNTPHGTDTHFAMTQAKYLPTPMAAQHLGHSQSWLLRRGDIPYLRGHPNVYSVKDLDDWFERNKWVPKD